VKNEEWKVQNVCHCNNLGMNELFDGLCFGHPLLKVCYYVTSSDDKVACGSSMYP